MKYYCFVIHTYAVDHNFMKYWVDLLNSANCQTVFCVLFLKGVITFVIVHKIVNNIPHNFNYEKLYKKSTLQQ